MRRQRISHYALGGALCVALLLSLFEVTLDPQFALPAEKQVPDPMQERLFADCLAARDRHIHAQAFASIDNPDVQKEFIATERDAARHACRERFPPRLQTARTPLRIKLLELRFRYRD